MTKRAQEYTPLLSKALAMELVMQAARFGRVSREAAKLRLANGFMYDVFGGTGGVSEHCCSLGLEGRIFDTARNVKHDVCRAIFHQGFLKAASYLWRTPGRYDCDAVFNILLSCFSFGSRHSFQTFPAVAQKTYGGWDGGGMGPHMSVSGKVFNHN